jgi:hypothetical protein
MKALIFRETGEPKSVLELLKSLLRLWPLAKRSSVCGRARSTHPICTWCAGGMAISRSCQTVQAMKQSSRNFVDTWNT